MAKYRDMSALKGRKIVYSKPHPTWIKNKSRVGSLHPLWKGDDAGYRAIHIWINKHRPRTGNCFHCYEPGRTGWANISREYRRLLNDWVELCASCHAAYDKGNRGVIKRRFQNV